MRVFEGKKLLDADATTYLSAAFESHPILDSIPGELPSTEDATTVKLGNIALFDDAQVASRSKSARAHPESDIAEIKLHFVKIEGIGVGAISHQPRSIGQLQDGTDLVKT